MSDDYDYRHDVGSTYIVRAAYRPEPHPPLLPPLPGWAWLLIALALPSIVIAVTRLVRP